MLHALQGDFLPVIGRVLVVAGVGGIGYTYVGYPVLLWVIAKFARKVKPVRSIEPGLTLIIAAHNEEASIRAKLEDVLGLSYPAEKLQIIVASDGSTDGTNEIVKEYVARGVELLEVKVRGGKTNAQNEAVQCARNPILVFSDATTIYDSMALQFIAGGYADPRVGAVSGQYGYYDPTSESPAASGSVKLWNLENRIKAMQSRIHTISGCCGCIYSVRRDLYTALPAETISDLVQPLCVLMKGYRVRFEESAQAWEEVCRTARDEFRMRVRVATRGIRGLFSVPELLMPWKHPWIAFQLWSHKVLRWSIPLHLASFLVGCALLASQTAFLVLALLQTAFYLFALLTLTVPAMRRSRLFSLPLYFCTINTAFLIGMFHAIRGRQFTIWQPTRG